MRITFVSPPPNLSGGCRVIALHAAGLQALGHEVLIAAPQHTGPSARARLRMLARGRWLRQRPKRSHYDGMNLRLRLTDARNPVTEADLPDADIVIATFWDTAFMVAGLPPSKGRQVYFVQHHETHLPGWRHLMSGSYRLPLAKITIAGWLARVMRDVYGDGDVPVVPNSVDQSLFHAPGRGRQAQPTVGLMYSAKRFKGLDTTLEAIRIARLRHPGLKVVVFGRETITRALPLPEGAVYFANPAQTALRDIYAMCDVFVAGSRSEGFGLPILEAMACRCPVVATRTGCAPDVITDGVNGFLADIEDAPALGGRIADLLDRDDAAWRAMSDAALARVSSYSWQDATRLFEAALRRLLPPDRV